MDTHYIAIEQLRAMHGTKKGGTFIIGVNLQLVKPEKYRVCQVCARLGKKREMHLWETEGLRDGEDESCQWWVCMREDFSDTCKFAYPGPWRVNGPATVRLVAERVAFHRSQQAA